MNDYDYILASVWCAGIFAIFLYGTMRHLNKNVDKAKSDLVISILNQEVINFNVSYLKGYIEYDVELLDGRRLTGYHGTRKVHKNADWFINGTLYDKNNNVVETWFNVKLSYAVGTRVAQLLRRKLEINL